MPLPIAWQLGIGAALSIFGGLLARRRANNRQKTGTARPATRTQITTQVTSERFILGRARVAPVIAKGYTTNSFNSVERKQMQGTDLHLAAVIASGPCDGIERMWITHEGEEIEIPLVRAEDPEGDILFPTKESGWQGTILIREYFKADGTQGTPLQRATRGQFGPDNRFDGISWVSIQIQQGYENEETNRKNGKIFRSIPSFEFQVKGLNNIPVPGTPDSMWTESAAAIWQWLLDTINVREENIDRDSFVAAEAITSHNLYPAVREGYAREDDNPRIRYSINGVVNGDDNILSVMESFNFQWQGSCPIINGRYTAIPGALRPRSFEITEDDVQEGSLQSIRIGEPIQQKVNGMTCTIPQSSDHSFTPLGLEYNDAALQARDRDFFVQDIGDLPFCAHAYEGGRLMAIATKLLSGRTFRFRLVNNPFLLAEINPGEQGTFVLPVEGVETPIHGLIDSAEISQDHTMELIFREIPDGAYDDVTVHPPDIPSSADHDIVAVFHFGGDRQFSGYFNKVSRWRWGFGDRTMLVADTAIDGTTNWNGLSGDTIVWPFTSDVSDSWYRTFGKEVENANFGYCRIDPVWGSPDGIPPPEVVNPTRIDIEVKVGGRWGTWIEAQAGRWVDLEARDIPRATGVRAIIHFEGSRNTVLTGVSITLANKKARAVGGDDITDADQDYLDSVSGSPTGDV